MYAIIDIETTGSVSFKDNITEIALFLHDGEKVVDQFCSLINPGRPIPPFITRLTGISDKMVASAPKFHEVAARILELTENAVFVAHNTSFDYNFLKGEFKSLGYNFRRNSLCTVQLSRNYLPGKKSYSLGKLCRELGITLNGRHRAGGDAEATVKVFELILQQASAEDLEQHINLDTFSLKHHKNIPQGSIENLKETAGVYYFYDSEGNMLYIGKSKNVRSRVMSHFTSPGSAKGRVLKNKVADIGTEYTGSELVALLLESAEIKKHQPPYNSAQRSAGYRFGIFRYHDQAGYLNFYINRLVEDAGEPVTRLFTYKQARNLLEKAVDKYQLCQKLSGLQKSGGKCFNYMVNKCAGACLQKELPESYNQRVLQADSFLHYENESFFIIDQGRTEPERAVVQVENGKYCGFGYVDISEGINNMEILNGAIRSFADNKDTTRIISGYLRKKKIEKIIRYKAAQPNGLNG